VNCLRRKGVHVDTVEESDTDSIGEQPILMSMSRIRAKQLAWACQLLLVFVCWLPGGAFGQAVSVQPARIGPQSTNRIIVKWKQGAPPLGMQQKAEQLSARAHMKITFGARIAPTIEVIELEHDLSGAALDELIERLQADPAVEYASPDLRRFPHVLPNDPLIADQWYLHSSEMAALRADAAWDITQGSSGTVVAVLDTGVRFDHPDLLHASEGGKLLPGFDFVSGESSSSFISANDGDGRDPDPSDPGDWVDEADLALSGFEDCEPRSSSWHGTRVTALIAARTNNGVGIAGVAWHAWILPVRVMGKCGGKDSDIIAAMRWAAGLDVPGVPANTHPAQIINLSLGGEGACTSAYQAVVNELAAHGILIVASAGNQSGPVNVPANCQGVLGVTGVRQAGTKAGFSNIGPQVGIAAPGGNCVNTALGQPCLFSIVTATNLGRTTPASSGYTDQFNFNIGTSFSAPLVSGTAALMHAVNGRLSGTHMIDRLQLSAMPFPTNPNTGMPNCRVPTGPDDLQTEECYCTTETCGAGLVDAAGAVAHALRPIAAVRAPDNILPGQSIRLDASISSAACNRAIVTYQWSIVSSTGTPPSLSGVNDPIVTIQAPATGELTVRVTVTDDTGATDTADVVVNSLGAHPTSSSPTSGRPCPTPIRIATTTAPPTSAAPILNDNASRGGGGQFDCSWLVVLALLRWMWRARRRSRASTTS